MSEYAGFEYPEANYLAKERVLRIKFRPIGERALVKVEARKEKTPSGIVLPETAKDKPQTARIIVVGDIENGGVGEGDLVVFAQYAGTEIKLGEEEYLILDSDDLCSALSKSERLG